MKIIQNLVSVLLVACFVLIAVSCRVVVLPSRDKNDQRDEKNNPYPADSTVIDLQKKEPKKE